METLQYKTDWDYHYTINFVLTDGDAVVASCQLQVCNNKCQFQGLYVQESYKNKGYGKYMFEIAMENYEKNLYPMELILKVRKDNVIAINMYKKKGFIFYMDDQDDELFEWMIKPVNYSICGTGLSCVEGFEK